jgi:hypothetical protein
MCKGLLRGKGKATGHTRVLMMYKEEEKSGKKCEVVRIYNKTGIGKRIL